MRNPAAEPVARFRRPTIARCWTTPRHGIALAAEEFLMPRAKPPEPDDAGFIENMQRGAVVPSARAAASIEVRARQPE